MQGWESGQQGWGAGLNTREAGLNTRGVWLNTRGLRLGNGDAEFENVSVISIDPPLKEGNARFTTVPLKPLCVRPLYHQLQISVCTAYNLNSTPRLNLQYAPGFVRPSWIQISLKKLKPQIYLFINYDSLITLMLLGNHPSRQPSDHEILKINAGDGHWKTYLNL